MSRMTHLAALAALFAAMAAMPAPQAAAKNNTGAIIGGIIAGAAVGASEMKHPKTVYVPARPPKPPSPQSFSPKKGVICYPVQRACYNDRGAYSANWTWKIYAK